MKINISRRRVKTIFAKWGGLILAAALVVPIAILSTTYLYANNRVDNTISWVTQNITIVNFDVAKPMPEIPGSAIYYLSISIYNDTPTSAHISITDAKMSLGDLNLAIIGSAGWQGNIAENSLLVFGGGIAISPDDAQQLGDQTLVMVITGTITAKVHFAFIEKEETRQFKITTEAVIPPPSTVTPTATE